MGAAVLYVEFVKSNVLDLPIRVAEGEGSAHMGECGMHLHDEVEILAGKSGCKQICVGDKTVKITPGDVAVINRRVPHLTKELEPYTADQMLQFRIEKLRAKEFEHMNRYISVLITGGEKPLVLIDKKEEAAKEIIRYITLMNEEEQKRRENYEMFIRGYMELILGTLYRNNILKDAGEAYNNDAVKKIWPVIEYIDKNYSKPLTLDELSGILNMNKQYFCRIFRKAVNTTPTEYINFVRVWKAENLLTTTDESVLEISMTVGFSSVSYFNRIFKKMKKTTPTVYRNILYAKNKMI